MLAERGPEMDLRSLSGKVVAMTGHVHAMTGPAAAPVELAEPQVRPRTRISQGDAGEDWLCFWCLNPVASEEDRFAVGGPTEFTFTNPEGVRFNLVTFSRTLGCRSSGTPTLEHTWFPGHAWCYAVCDRCRMQLGWFYTGPSEFAGLIRERIVRAAVVLS